MSTTTNKPIAFVAYTGRDHDVANAIQQAVSHANSYQQSIRFESWIYNDTPGRAIVSPVLEKIDDSQFIVADITYLNLNVVYEIGFAIGRNKRVFLIRHASTKGDKDLAKETGIFDTLGYQEYSDFEELKDRLTSYIDPTPLNTTTTLDRQVPVYIIEPPTRPSEIILIASRVKKAKYRYRSFNPGEDIRLSATDAIRQVASSAGVIVPLQNERINYAVIHNVRAQFVAGLAHGMGKPTLILSPSDCTVPIDVRDEVKRYYGANEINDHIADFCLDINEYLQDTDSSVVEKSGLLQTLSVGDPTAENEMTTLSHYYLRTDQYQRALRGEVNLVVGRKGSGKTALFIRLRDRIRSDSKNVVVDLKPEGYQLAKIKEDILEYITDGARQHLITAFWEYLILLEIAYKLLEKDRNSTRLNKDLSRVYYDLKDTYQVNDFSSEGDFSERLQFLSQRLSEQYKSKFGDQGDQKLTSHQVTELLYSHDIRSLRTNISSYLNKKNSVWVLFDNLDKGWSTRGVDDIDTLSIRCLIDAGRKIERDLRKSDHTVRCIVFLRNDVYENLMKNSADYGKEMRATLDWTDADLLREMLRLRFVSDVEGLENLSFQEIWSRLCVSHQRGEETSAYLIDRSLMRPRNVLKLFNYARGFANNFNRSKITEEDIDKGVKSYSQDLITELSRELTDVFPQSEDLLYQFIDASSVLEESDLIELLKGSGFQEDDLEAVIDFLLYYSVLGIRLNDVDYFIYDVNYDLKPIKIRISRAAGSVLYLINPAFWPALGVREIARA